MLDLARGLAFLVGFFFIGNGLHRLGVPIPGGVLGLLLLSGALNLGLVRLAWLQRAADLLLRHMVLLFVPLTVGLMEMGHVLSSQSVALIVSLLVSFVAVLLTTGLLARWLVAGLPSDAEVGE